MSEVYVPEEGEFNVPPENLQAYCMVIYGEKGVGKTSLAAQFPRSVIGMLEPRRRNLKVRQTPLLQWEDVESFIDICCHRDDVDNVVIDTVDRAYSLCLEYNCRIRGIKDPSDLNDYGATWRAIKDQFERTLNKVLFCEKGLVMISHAHWREAEVRTGEKFEILCPTCSPAAFLYLKAVADYAFYMGYNDRRRAMYLRGHDDLWSSCGTEDHFLDPNGDPVKCLILGESPEQAFQTLVDGFDNKRYDADYQGPTPAKTARRKQRVEQD